VGTKRFHGYDDAEIFSVSHYFSPCHLLCSESVKSGNSLFPLDFREITELDAGVLVCSTDSSPDPVYHCEQWVSVVLT